MGYRTVRHQARLRHVRNSNRAEGNSQMKPGLATRNENQESSSGQSAVLPIGNRLVRQLLLPTSPKTPIKLN
jgi:hypothetical protein